MRRILLLLVPVPVTFRLRWDGFTQLVFVLSNCIALLFEISDWAYFPYNFKRSTADVLKMVSRQGDFWSLLPSYLLNYWYVPLAAGLFIFVLIKANRLIRRLTPLLPPQPPVNPWLFAGAQLVIMVVVAGIAAIGIRGGLQYIPIGLRNAVQVTDSKYVPIVLNTPFSIVTTLMTPSLEEVHYMPDDDAKQLMPFTHQYSGKAFVQKNVVMIILESGSKEFTSLGSGPSFTPFLDSLMGLGFTCTQAFANGQTSAEGIPAILAGMPTLMDEAFTTSNYGTNRITALPGLLGSQGYSSAFYHGGTNGTMSFDIFSDAAGFDQYFGRSEYGREADYDGAWGIRDEPFLQYFAAGLGKLKPPFFASVFTLTAHPPYNLPEEYRKSLPAGPLPVQQCIAYTDMALRKFFATAARQPWYDSTLFVITADHCSPQNNGGYYGQGMGQYAIPMLFYAPGDSGLRGRTTEPVQQLDILPSVMQYLGYGGRFFAFGNSIFAAAEPRYAITYNSEAYQWLESGHVLRTAAMKPVGYYAFPADSNSTTNLLNTAAAGKAESMLRLQAFVQRYRQALLHNALQ